MLARAAKSYRDVDLESAPNTQIVERLFARFARDCGDAERAIKVRDIVAKAAAIDHATAIVVQLRTGLDHRAAPELSGHLDSLYCFVIAQLAATNATLKPKPLVDAARIMASLADAFARAHVKMAQGLR